MYSSRRHWLRVGRDDDVARSYEQESAPQPRRVRPVGRPLIRMVRAPARAVDGGLTASAMEGQEPAGAVHVTPGLALCVDGGERRADAGFEAVELGGSPASETMAKYTQCSVRQTDR